ncbi:pilus assembly protein [Natronosporangium hydrolyticum]|uniref:Pilus assembly protein n=1 Tax=Natronosporangium hydrolyticum TaxID=2811111 RepID=A0A895YD66_9ACTN|nr:TadE family protein [Natronosporangium hydrolyticum]QSB15727.1 pilus assembly protein [Natronosporangium hydrolyticum]
MIRRRGLLRPDRESGSVTVEMAILTPVFLLIIVAAIVFGRTAVALNAIDVAAHDAARAASISRSEAAAAGNAQNAAAAALAEQGLNCAQPPTVTPQLSGFSQTGTDLAFVSVTVSCEVSFTDLALPGVPNSFQLQSTFVSPLDSYRER